MSDPTRSPVSEWFAADAQRRKDRKEGIARIGGVIGVDYVTAYFRAARLLVEATADNRPEMAVPCLYLQRHAVELACKYLIEFAFLIRAQRSQIDTLERTGEVSGGKAQQAVTGHDLAELTTIMGDALNEIGYESPPQLVSLALELDKFEDGDPTRSRYPAGRKGKYAEDSFPTPTIIPVVEWQRRLEVIEHDVFTTHVMPDEARRTICDDLYTEYDVNKQTLFDLSER